MRALYPNFWCLLALGAILIGSPSLSWAQSQLTPDQITAALTFKIEQNFSGVDLWNIGYDFYRRQPRSQATAKAIYLGYLRAQGSTADQKKTLKQAAAYWKKIVEQGDNRVIVGQESWAGVDYHSQRGRFESTLSLKPGSGQGPHARGQQRRLKTQPSQERRHNPYPGSYYPGVYPPN